MTSDKKFNDAIHKIKNSQHITKNQKEYLEMKLQTKELWAKCYLKSKFTGGISTTSRIEGLHAKQKKYLTSNTNLQGVFQGFRSIEKIHINRFKDEYLRHGQGTSIQNVNMLDELKKQFPEYIYKKLYPKYGKGLNYKHHNLTAKSWYFSFNV